MRGMMGRGRQVARGPCAFPERGWTYLLGTVLVAPSQALLQLIPLTADTLQVLLELLPLPDPHLRLISSALLAGVHAYSPPPSLSRPCGLSKVERYLLLLAISAAIFWAT